MSQPGLREVEHDITVAAPAAAIYRLIAEVENWPRIFPPTIYVDHAERGEREERIRIWATANGEAKTWSSRRTLDPEGMRITFRQEVSAPPVASMGGTWVIEPASGGQARVRLRHDYRAIDDDPGSLDWIAAAVDRNSRAELAALKENVELARASADLTFSFEDAVLIRGAAEDAYDFINEAGRWPERLPHVSAVRLQQPAPGLQVLDMDTRAPDDSTHATKSYRVCFPHLQIVYKQVTLPALLTLHTGRWQFRADAHGVVASSQHTVVLDTDNISRVLGEGATTRQARDYVRSALSANSRATLNLARDYAERPR